MRRNAGSVVLPALPLALALLAVAAGCGGGGDGGGEEAARLADARQAVQVFGGALKQELTAGMARGGPEEALRVCRERAPEIAGRTAEETGWQVRRTALRVRNPENVPDAWERGVLEDFAARLASGEDAAGLERHEVVDQDGQRVFRYMKAIATGKLCLRCHGGELEPATTALLAELYPEDQAVDFAEGDLRGAFSLRRPL